MKKTLIVVLGVVAALGLSGCKSKSAWQAEYQTTLAAGEAKYAEAKKSNAVWTQKAYVKQKQNYWTGMVAQADKLSKDGKYEEAIAELNKGIKLLDLSMAQHKHEVTDKAWEKEYNKFILGK
jgi:predicted Zn-dependent protease